MSCAAAGKTSRATVCQGSIFLQFCDKIQQSNPVCPNWPTDFQLFPYDHHTLGVSQDLPSNSISTRFTTIPLAFVA